MPRKFDLKYAASVFKGIFNRGMWDTVIRDVDARIADLEQIKPELDSAIDDLTKVGLDRINSVLAPAVEKVVNLADLGFLIAHSSTSITLNVSSDVITFVIPPGAERDLFTPSPFVTISRVANYTDYAFAKTLGYDVIHGEYSCQILARFGNAGPFTDWVLSDGSGVAQAVQQMMEDTQDARDASIAASVTATTQAGLASDYADDAQTAAAAVQAVADELAASGPVTSVNGHNGIVVLNPTDVGALAATSNLSDLSNPKTARVNLGVDKRSPIGDANYTILATDAVVALSVALTASRVWTLPAANSFNAGQRLFIVDEVGGVSGTKTLTVQRAASDLINGTTTQILNYPYQSVCLISDGFSRWTYDALRDGGPSRGGGGGSGLPTLAI